MFDIISIDTVLSKLIIARKTGFFAVIHFLQRFLFKITQVLKFRHKFLIFSRIGNFQCTSRCIGRNSLSL